MFIKRILNPAGVYLQLCKSYRDPKTKKPKHKILFLLGKEGDGTLKELKTAVRRYEKKRKAIG